MSKIRYSELSEQQRKYVCNGCGAKGGWFNPPEFLFHASCNQHDFYYWRGGSEADRFEADFAFYEFMKKDAELAPTKTKKIINKSLAYVYYKSVRFFGKGAFNYSNEYRTIADLIREIELKG